MSHNSEVDIDYESLPIGAGKYTARFLSRSYLVSPRVVFGWGWGCLGFEDW